MSLFYQLTQEVYATTKSSWNLNYKNTRFNTKISKIYNLELPYFDMPFQFSSGRSLKGSFVTSDPNAQYETNGATNSDYNINLLVSEDVGKANPSLKYNNILLTTSFKK